jgi:ribonuclease T1
VRTPQRTLVGLLLALLTAAVLWWTQGDGTTPGDDVTATDSSDSSVADPDQRAGTDPVSGLPLVPLDRLPREAAGTVELIDAGGPFPEDEDGGTFGNREDLLPDEPMGDYAEYTVPTPGSDGRGARRIVSGDEGELYWTEDHYASFERIVR